MATKTSGGDGMDYRITTIAFNFDITANWATGDLAFPVTDQASFEVFLASRNYNYTNNLTNIVISNFSIVGNRITCNLSADGTILDISNMQVTDMTSIGNLGQLQYLYLNNNQIITFDPTIALPISLQSLHLYNNQMTIAGYTASETWANTQPIFTSLCNVSLIVILTTFLELILKVY